MNDLPLLSENKFKKLKALHAKKFRERDSAFLAEGIRLCEEAVNSHVEIITAVVSETGLHLTRIQAFLSQTSAPVFLATDKQMQQLSDTENPQGICLQIKIPQHAALEFSNIILALDALQDPGNVGTILRTAEWFGIQSILLGSGTVDVYNSKVVRSSMGSIFRLHLYQDVDLSIQLETLSQNGYHIAAAVMHGNVEISRMPHQKTVLIIGNEANGIAASILDQADSLTYIPRYGNGESLNAAVAASLFMYQLTLHE